MTARRSADLLNALALVAPGSPLRDGLDRILLAGMGALIVVADGPEVLNICSGGFLLDAAYSPQRLSELAKMDGAIILAPDASRIARANVHLVPNPNVPTSETGTRHRTAERVARSISVPVISVSQRMNVISVYAAGEKHEIEPVPRVINRANQAVQTLERYKARLDEVSVALSALEIEDLVTLRDVVSVLQRNEMVARIAEEIEGYIIELGEDGRLVRLQLEELMGGIGDDRRLVVRDYFSEAGDWELNDALRSLEELSNDQLLDLRRVAATLHAGVGVPDLDQQMSPRGYRLLSRIPRLPVPVVEAIVERFGALQKILRATIDDLDDVEGVGSTRARAIKDGLSRLAEASILDRYT
ncbi:MAG: DNA integrity scanning protein DisA [Actinobacteria bacterium]|nr:DNA integrity scanning protein DisA [Actinomycetota bacterium]